MRGSIRILFALSLAGLVVWLLFPVPAGRDKPPRGIWAGMERAVIDPELWIEVEQIAEEPEEPPAPVPEDPERIEKSDPKHSPAATDSPVAAGLPDLPPPAEADEPAVGSARDAVHEPEASPAADAASTNAPPVVDVSGGSGRALADNSDTTEETAEPAVTSNQPAAPVYTPPVLLRDAPPAYPAAARMRGWEGRVVLEYLVTAEGRVTEIRVVESSGHDLLDRAAVKAAADWLYLPARLGDLAVESRMRRAISFRLR